MITGTVAYVNEKPWNGQMLHSFKLTNDNNYYNCGTDKPAIAKGQIVEFEATMRKEGSFQVNLPTIKVIKEATTEIVTPQRGGFRKTFGGNAVKDAYWTEKAERDVVTQSVIQLQSSRNSAIAAAALILQHGGIDLEKTKKSSKKDVIEALIDGLTEKYETQATARRSGISSGTVGTVDTGATDTATSEVAVSDESEWS